MIINVRRRSGEKRRHRFRLSKIDLYPWTTGFFDDDNRLKMAFRRSVRKARLDVTLPPCTADAATFGDGPPSPAGPLFVSCAGPTASGRAARRDMNVAKPTVFSMVDQRGPGKRAVAERASAYPDGDHFSGRCAACLMTRRPDFNSAMRNAPNFRECFGSALVPRELQASMNAGSRSAASGMRRSFSDDLPSGVFAGTNEPVPWTTHAKPGRRFFGDRRQLARFRGTFGTPYSRAPGYSARSGVYRAGRRRSTGRWTRQCSEIEVCLPSSGFAGL